jgi:hypothetical protein
MAAVRHMSVVAACVLLLAGCAAQRPPTATTAAELAAPHRVILGKPNSSIKVDADTSVTVPRFIPLSPIGLVAGAAATAIVAGAQMPEAAIRGARRDTLVTALGNTEAVAAEFAGTFNSAFQQAMRDAPGLRSVVFEDFSAAAAAEPSAEAKVFVGRDAVLASNGRALVGRATITYTAGEGAARRSAFRRFAVFSEDVPASSDAEAITAWTADDKRLLRERARSVASELASLVRSVTVDPNSADLDNLPQVQIATSGVAIVLGTTASGQEHTVRLPQRARGRLLRQANGRAVVVMGLGTEADVWTWINVPASAIVSDRMT